MKKIVALLLALTVLAMASVALVFASIKAWAYMFMVVEVWA